jgi:hypothetical protein
MLWLSALRTGRFYQPPLPAKYSWYLFMLRGRALGWGTVLQTRTWRVRFPMESLEFFSDWILPVEKYLKLCHRRYFLHPFQFLIHKAIFHNPSNDGITIPTALFGLFLLLVLLTLFAPLLLFSGQHVNRWWKVYLRN